MGGGDSVVEVRMHAWLEVKLFSHTKMEGADEKLFPLRRNCYQLWTRCVYDCPYTLAYVIGGRIDLLQ